MNLSLDDFHKFIGTIVTYAGIGGLIAAAIGILFKKVAEKWIDNHFEQRKQEFEHEQAKELQKLKVKIDTTIQGALKLQEREFTLIPDTLSKLTESFWKAHDMCNPLRRFIRASKYSHKQLMEAFEKYEIAGSDREKIKDLQGDAKDAAWNEVLYKRQYFRTLAAVQEAKKTVSTNGVFLPDELRKKFDTLVQHQQMAIEHHYAGATSKPPEPSLQLDAWEMMEKEAKPLLDEVQALVRTRLLQQTELVHE